MGIIDNKKIDLTSDEWNLYNKIVKSYTSPTNKGEDLFQDLFETDNNGIIIFLKPPSKRQTSFEVFLFLISVTVQQHLRLAHLEVSDIVKQMKDKMKELEDKLEKLSSAK